MLNINDYINTEKVLNEEEDYKLDESFDYEGFSINDLCLVHTTDYFPFNHTISSSFDKKVQKETNNGKWYDQRKTIHFCLNGLVSDHPGNEFQGRKFAILEPLKYQIDNVYAARPEDTWTSSSVKLSDKAIILVDERFKDELKEEDLSSYKVIYFSGDMKIAVERVLKSLGYKPQRIGVHGFAAALNYMDLKNNDNIIYDFIEKNYKNISTIEHCDSYYSKIEADYRERDQILSLYDGKIKDTTNGYKLSNDEFLFLMETNNVGLEQSDVSYDRFCSILFRYGIIYDEKVNGFRCISEQTFLDTLQAFENPKLKIQKQDIFIEAKKRSFNVNAKMYEQAFNKYNNLIVERQQKIQAEKKRNKERIAREVRDKDYYSFLNQPQNKKLVEYDVHELNEFLRRFISEYGNSNLYFQLNSNINSRSIIIDCENNELIEDFKKFFDEKGINCDKYGEATIIINNSIKLNDFITNFTKLTEDLNKYLQECSKKETSIRTM